jgi:hypothetical protein
MRYNFKKKSRKNEDISMKKRLTLLAAGIVILFALLFHFGEQRLTNPALENTTDAIADSETKTDSTLFQISSKEPADSQTENQTSQTDTEVSQNEAQNESEKNSAFSEAELPNHLQYYYGTLSDADKLLYRQIYVVIRDHLDYTDVDTTDSDTISDVMEYVLLDNPELFYVDSLKTQTTTIGNSSSMALTASESMSSEEQKTAFQKISDFSANALSGISAGMTEYDKALSIYTYVVSHLQYVDGAPYNQSLYSAALGQTVCRGYTCAYKYLCDQLGIPCIVVTGTMQGESHAWNMVYLDGQWCYVDCTAGDDLSDQGIDVDYSWFGLDSASLSQSHTFRKASLLPAADSMANAYYYRKGLYFDHYSADSVTGLLSAGSDFSFQCQTEAVFNEYCDQFSSSQDIAQAIGPGKEVQFLANSSTYTIYIEFS